MYFHEKDIVEQYTQFLVLYWRFIHDIFVIWCGPRDTLLEFPGAFYYKKDRIKLVVLVTLAFVSKIFVYIRIFPKAYCSFLSA